MKEMTLRELQLFLLEILKDVHTFCVTNNISYSLGCGTLIGAVRHKGFIPWDDDIDIIMPRPDYERFCKIYSSDKFCIADRHNSYIEFARVYDVTRTYCSTKLPWKQGISGAWIDIFPLDAISDDMSEYKQRYRKVEKMLRRQWRIRSSLVGFDQLFDKRDICGSIMDCAKLLIKKILYAHIDIVGHNASFNDLIQTHEWGTTSRWSQLGCSYGTPNEYGNNEWLYSYKLMDFEDERFYVLKGYDEWLRNKYGDYMKLPQEEDCKRHTINNFYWKS